MGVYFQKGKVGATTSPQVAFKRRSDWQQWVDDSTLRTANFEFNCSVTQKGDKTDVGSIKILKDRHFLEIYLDLLDGLDPKNVFEIGFFQGGMPLFLCDIVGPDKIVGIDRHPPSKNLIEIIERSGFKDCVKLYGGILQDDTSSIKELLNVEFGDKPLDIIIDDCSHEYRNSKICFQEYFGYLRTGGKYLIEDWGWLHWPGILWQTRENPFHGQTPMTNLIFELVMVLGSCPHLVSRVDVVCDSLVVITRGPGLGHKERLDIDRSHLTSGRHLDLFGGGSPSDWSKPSSARRRAKVFYTASSK